MKTQQMRQYSVEGAEGDVSVARQTQTRGLMRRSSSTVDGLITREDHESDGAVSIRR